MRKGIYIEDAVELKDYVKVIFDRKLTILSVFFLSIFIGALISFFTINDYELSMVIKVVGNKYQNRSIINTVDVNERVKEGKYYIAKMYKDKQLDFSMFKSKYIGNVVNVSIVVSEKDLMTYENALKDLFEWLKKDTKPVLQKINGLIDNNIHDREGKILEAKFANEITDRSLEEKQCEIKNIEEEETRLRKNIMLLENKYNTMLDVLKKEDVSSNDNDFWLVFLPLMSVLREEYNELRLLESRAIRLKKDVFVLTNDKKKKTEEILFHQSDIERSKEELSRAGNIVDLLSISKKSIYKSRLKKNIIIFAMLGIILGVFVAFFLEILKEYRNK